MCKTVKGWLDIQIVLHVSYKAMLLYVCHDDCSTLYDPPKNCPLRYIDVNLQAYGNYLYTFTHMYTLFL